MLILCGTVRADSFTICMFPTGNASLQIFGTCKAKAALTEKQIDDIIDIVKSIKSPPALRVAAIDTFTFYCCVTI